MDGQTVHVKIELLSDTLLQNVSAAVEKQPFEDGDKVPHIFQKAQVTLNKNAHNLQHHFWAQFFMLFHMM